jgi:hypothetical protein
VVTFNGRELTEFCTSHSEVGFNIMQGVAHVIAERLHKAYIQLLGVTEED